MNTRLAAGSGLSDVEAIEVDWLPELMQFPDKFVDLKDKSVDGRWLDWKVAQATGRLVPGDVAVVGYDNLGAATTTSPTLTTIVNPVVAMAHTAGQMLIDLLTGKKVDQAPVIFAPELVVRLSA